MLILIMYAKMLLCEILIVKISSTYYHYHHYCSNCSGYNNRANKIIYEVLFLLFFIHCSDLAFSLAKHSIMRKRVKLVSDTSPLVLLFITGRNKTLIVSLILQM